MMNLLNSFSSVAGILGNIQATMIGLVVFLVVCVLWAVGAYNSLVTLRNGFKNAFAQIDVELKRRHDLIPNLVETVKKYMSHERETLEAVIEARNTASSAREGISPDDAAAMKNLMGAEAALTSGLGKIFALSESYPELRSSENMQQLTAELSSTENQVANARSSYNNSVTAYNTKREVFPSSIIAGIAHFAPAVLFELTTEKEREVVKVSFD